MELFCLGVVAPDGRFKYAQADVSELARALTGWTLSTTSGAAGYTITFTPSRFDMAAKNLFSPDPIYGTGGASAPNPFSAKVTIPAVTGSTNTTTNPASLQWGPSAVNAALDAILAHANHAQFLIRKLWA